MRATPGEGMRAEEQSVARKRDGGLGLMRNLRPVKVVQHMMYHALKLQQSGVY